MPRKRKQSSQSDEETEEDELVLELGEEETKELLDILDLINPAKRRKLPSVSNPYDEYLSKLSSRQKNVLLRKEKKIIESNKSSIPLRFKIIESDMDDKIKGQLLQKAIHFESLPEGAGEYFKLKRFMEGLLKIPFKKYAKLPISNRDPIEKKKNFVSKLKNQLDSCIFGQETAKNSILQIIAKWITNPKGTGNIIGLCGPAGVGKTSIVKNGLSKALNLPFGFIPLGGSSNASNLQGFDYTYEGSKWGRIVEILIENKYMNPIIFFDELDKISDTKEGMEIISLLIHLTDPSQNNSFADKYFSGIEFDLSKSFLIFSFNDENKINPILRDRITIVKLDGFDPPAKIKIAQDFSLDKICKNIGFNKEDIVLPEETLRVIISNYCNEKGVRKLEKCLETLIMKLNLYHITKDFKNLNLKEDLDDIESPYEITPVLATKLLDPVFRKDDMSLAVRMMYS